MNLIDKKAFIIAGEYKDLDELTLLCTANNLPGYPSAREIWQVPSIQRQAFAERIHYIWLCLTRNIAITDKHGNVIWEPHESARS